MKDDDVFQTLENCWRGLCRGMRENPTAETQRVMNMLSRILAHAKSEMKKRKASESQQISIDEWMEWLAEQ